ncbi:Uncharacterized protein PECH_004409 [Penicillium ucsense]|uniref:Uncharacterized protein n=1 Tax=Penicillium ucsense TaxID=2839758 RepID=A0A8J8W6B2_9EURO|nr:Uncharacterized protein PECM_005363 [Penicillium ucsense]KAF7737093.1 Uncharacterized protein PECH_004409 [Penicillium ucsense]
METSNQANQPPQPSKEAAYAQASNPISQTPSEQRAPAQSRQYGDPTASITRGPSSQPSSDEARNRLEAERQQHRDEMGRSQDVDTEYGIEQQPAEGYIADTVARKGMGMQRAQAGAHAGPVGNARGPGHPGFGEERDLAANMDEKRSEHDRVLAERVESSLGSDVAEREGVRDRKMQQNEEVERALKESSGTPVV